MYRNVNLDAHLSALLFLGASALLLVLLVTAFASLFYRKQWMRYTLTAVVVLVGGYVLALFAFSLFSHEQTLAAGEEKYFCELDCHVAYSVQKAERVKAIGNTSAEGGLYVVTDRPRFDEKPTAPCRPRDVPVTPDPLCFVMISQDGAAVSASPSGQRA